MGMNHSLFLHSLTSLALFKDSAKFCSGIGINDCLIVCRSGGQELNVKVTTAALAILLVALQKGNAINWQRGMDDEGRNSPERLWPFHLCKYSYIER